MKKIFEWFFLVTVALVMTFIINTFLYQSYRVSGESMYPTLYGEEMLFLNKWKYRMSEPKYGDIVVIHTDQETSYDNQSFLQRLGVRSKRVDYIKRIVGLPGDEIEVKLGQLVRNNKIIEEKFINGLMNEDFYKIVVPKGTYFVMGDNRNASKDSRRIGPIKREDIAGRADFVFWPLKSIGVLR